MDFAPIALFVYNRLDVLEKTVFALKNNTLAPQSELFIFADGEKSPNDPKVKAVRDYIKTINGFKKIIIIEQEKNVGLANSIIAGVTKIVNDFGKIIVVEDDIVTSPHFLKFMNDALNMYENDEAAACITGYTYPIIEKMPQPFFLKGADCWGWATWKRAWDLFEVDATVLLDEIKERKLEKEFDFNNSSPYLQMLQDQIDGKNSSWAVRWYASAFLKNKLCLYFGKPMVQNIGFEADATHCANLKAYCVELNLEQLKLQKIEVKENKKMRKKFENFFNKLSGKKDIIRKAKRFLLKRKIEDGRKVLILFNLLKIKHWNKGEQYGYSGDYNSWEEVEKLSCGYSSSNILEKTLLSVLKVKNGEAVFERDSYLFDKVQYSWALLAGLFKAAATHNNKLNVLDFGGALGSHYFQNKEFLMPVEIENWTVVEQEHYVTVGNEQIAGGVLKFANSIDEVQNANVLILSSVLQYLPTPYEWLERFIDKKIDYIIFDRTAFNKENKDRLTLQTVPPEIYDASYPAWFLDEQKFLTYFKGKYELIADFEALAGKIQIVEKNKTVWGQDKGFIFRRIGKDF